MGAVYNENEPYAAEWLRNLIAGKHIASGSVDQRSIRDLAVKDVRDAMQFHAFAGIGVWSHALRLAGWPDDVPVWTGSCPCQPFSLAGKRGGFDDERHLWPEWFRLIRKCHPVAIFGEQVGSPDGLKWFDAVSTDLENEDYAVWAADMCAASAGAPHIRQRLFFMAIADSQRCDRIDALLQRRRSHKDRVEASRRGKASNTNTVGDSVSARLAGRSGKRSNDGPERTPSQRTGSARIGTACAVENSDIVESGEERESRSRQQLQPSRNETTGFWSNVEWLQCTDGKLRPTQPGIFPLVDGTAARMGKGSTTGTPSRTGMLRAYGNAIVPQVAALFIEAAMEAIHVAYA